MDRTVHLQSLVRECPQTSMPEKKESFKNGCKGSQRYEKLISHFLYAYQAFENNYFELS